MFEYINIRYHKYIGPNLNVTRGAHIGEYPSWSNNSVGMNTRDLFYSVSFTIQHPWRRVNKFNEPEKVFVMVRRNYKIFANIDLSRRCSRTFAKLPDTGSWPTIIKNDVLHESTWKTIRTCGKSVKIRDANNRSVNVDGITDLVVKVGGSVETIHFNVVELLVTQVILVHGYCEKHIESIRLSQQLVELADGTSVPTNREPPPKENDSIPLHYTVHFTTSSWLSSAETFLTHVVPPYYVRHLVPPCIS